MFASTQDHLHQTASSVRCELKPRTIGALLYFHSFFCMSRKLITLILVVVLGALALVNYSKRMELSKTLDSMTIGQTGDGVADAARAKEVIQKLKRHMMILGDVEPTVAQVVDVEALKSKNTFYENAENGDYLVITPLRAVLYSEKKDLILDVVPVQLTPPEQVTGAAPQP